MNKGCYQTYQETSCVSVMSAGETLLRVLGNAWREREEGLVSACEVSVLHLYLPLTHRKQGQEIH